MTTNQVSVLAIDDVLDNAKGVEVRGMFFDAEYNVVIRKNAEGIVEIESHQVGPIGVVVGNDILKLDQEQLKTGRRGLYNDILAAFEKEALKKANNVPDYKWSVEEYAV